MEVPISCVQSLRSWFRILGFSHSLGSVWPANVSGFPIFARATRYRDVVLTSTSNRLKRLLTCSLNFVYNQLVIKPMSYTQ